MSKLALVLHGWPQPVTKENFLYQYFQLKGLVVLAPYFFDEDYRCDLKGIKEEVTKKLEGRSPEVIIGISMGGLILPHIAGDFPQAKLVFIASGPFVKAEWEPFNFLLSILNNSIILKILGKMANFLPENVFCSPYRFFAPFWGKTREIKAYLKDMRVNLNYLKEISPEREKQIIELVSSINNVNLLKKIKNRSLIFSGLNDQLMPVNLGRKLHHLLPNSELVITKGNHFNVFTEENLSDLDRFLKL